MYVQVVANATVMYVQVVANAVVMYVQVVANAIVIYVRVVANDVVISSFFLLAQQPPVGQDLLIHEVSRSHTTTHHSQ
jgi:hypothetical protein